MQSLVGLRPGESVIRYVSGTEDPSLIVFPRSLICVTIIFAIVLLICAAIGLIAGIVVMVLLLAVIGFYAYTRYQKVHRVVFSYVLTTQRALVLDNVGGISRSCDLTPDTIPIASASFSRSVGSSGGQGRVVATTSITYGDVDFLQGGVSKLKFVGVPDPQGIVNAAQAVIRSVMGAAFGQPQGQAYAPPYSGPSALPYSTSAPGYQYPPPSPPS